jgi:hypothetical protein
MSPKINTVLIRSIYAILVGFGLMSCNPQKAPVLAPEYLYNISDHNVITSVINHKQGTISVIYGNKLALQAAQSIVRERSPGERYIMVTWKQIPMPHWYGTNMNGRIISIETVKILSASKARVIYKYQYKPQSPIQQATSDINHVQQVRFIAGQPAAVYP